MTMATAAVLLLLFLSSTQSRADNLKPLCFGAVYRIMNVSIFVRGEGFIVRSILGFKIKSGVVGILTGVIFASLLLITGGKPVHAAADTCTWTGAGGDSNLTTSGNWTGCDNGTVPENGDDLRFPTGPTNKTVTLDSALEFRSVTFSGSGYSVETTDLGNNQLFVTSDLTIIGDNNTFDAFVRFFDDSGVALAHSGTGTVFSHYIVMQPGSGDPNVTLNIQTDMSVPMIAQTSNPVGAIYKTGAGTLDVTGAAIAGVTTTNSIDVTDGKWQCDTTNCLGNNSNLVELSGGASLVLAQAGTINVGSVTGDGIIAMNNANALLILGNGNTSNTFSGVVQGYIGSTLEIVDGTWTFLGTNTDVGNGFSSYYINGGTILADAADTSLGSSPFSISAGILGGSGTVGPLSVYGGGTVAPGNSPGCLVVNGDTAFQDSTSIYSEQIQGITACTGYDQLTATGTIYLNNATFSLEVTPSLVISHDQVFTIMSATAINGTFHSLPDGSTVTVNSLPFRINYTAKTVTLTYLGGLVDSTTPSTSPLAGTGQNMGDFLAISVVMTTGATLLIVSRRRTFRR